MNFAQRYFNRFFLRKTTCFYPIVLVSSSLLSRKVQNNLMRIPMKKIECSVTCFQFICFMVFLRIFLLFYIWAQIDYDLISCDIFIFRPRVTSSGHSLLKSRNHRVKMWINERSEWGRVRHLFKLSLKSSKETGIELYKTILIRKKKFKMNLNHSNINIEQG